MKQLQNDFTTPEQSKRLLELGVPEWTANWKLSKLVKDSHGQKPKGKHDWEVNRKDYTHMIVGFMKYDYLPCWSVGRLIEIDNICSTPKIKEAGFHLMRTDFDDLIETMFISIRMKIEHGWIDFSKLEDYE